MKIIVHDDSVKDALAKANSEWSVEVKEDDDDGGGGLSTGAIVGIVIGCVTVVAVAVVLIVLGVKGKLGCKKKQIENA